MTTHPTASDPYRTHRRIARAWFAVGVLVVLFVPEARGAGGTFGWLPFWLLVAPVLVSMQVEVLAGFVRAKRWRRRLEQMRHARRRMAVRRHGARRHAAAA